MNKKILTFLVIAALVIVLIIGGLFIIFKPWEKTEAPQTQLDVFAKCLSDKGIVMYGLKNCPHCVDQKNLFGDAFKFVNYVECSSELKKCELAGINAVPAWVLSDKTKFEGTKTFKELSDISGCPLNETK